MAQDAESQLDGEGDKWRGFNTCQGNYEHV